jgi:hypothetical protein
VHLPEETETRFITRFLQPPVFSSKLALGLGTLYTAAYRPTTRGVSYLWPRQRWDTSIAGPLEGSLCVDYAAT